MVSETGEIALDFWGDTAVLQDSLVTGMVTLNGGLSLNFGNGYAPQTGDKLTLMTASGLSGEPTVGITGLEDGFEFALGFSNGAWVLTALNAGVPSGTTTGQRLYLPLVVNGGGLLAGGASPLALLGLLLLSGSWRYISRQQYDIITT